MVAARRRARLDLDARVRGTRGRLHLGQPARRPAAGGRGDGPAGLPGTADPHQRGRRRPVQGGDPRPPQAVGRPGQWRDHRHLVPGRDVPGHRRHRRRRDPSRCPRGRIRARRHVRAGGGRRRGGPDPGDGPVRSGAGAVPGSRRYARADHRPRGEPRSRPSVRPPAVPTGRSGRRRRARGAGVRRPSTWSVSSRMRSPSSARRWSVPSTGSSNSPSSTPRTGSPSAGRWPRTRRSSTDSPT